MHTWYSYVTLRFVLDEAFLTQNVLTIAWPAWLTSVLTTKTARCIFFLQGCSDHWSVYLLLGKEPTPPSKCLHARRKDIWKKIPLCYVCCLFSQRPGANIQSLKEYKRSRQRQAASAPIANTLVPQAITDTKLDDVIIQVVFIKDVVIAFEMSGIIKSKKILKTVIDCNY